MTSMPSAGVRPSRRADAVRLVPFALAIRVLAACTGTPNATFELDVSVAVAQAAAWYEVGVFPGNCPSASILLGGIPENGEGVVGRVAFAASAATMPALGNLAKGSYGIGGVARAADCSVIATGCSAYDVKSSGALRVSLVAVTGNTRGACSAGSVCDNADCLPTADAAVSAGPPCSLALIGAGPLGDPLGDTATLLSAPAIAATPSGFLLAYREFDPTAGDARLTTIAIDPGGGADTVYQTMLPGACTGSPQTDGTALAFSGTAGTLAVSRPACPAVGNGTSSSGGVDLFAVDSVGSGDGSAFSSAGGADVALAQAHALAFTPGGLLLAYTNEGTESSFAASVVGTALPPSPAPVPFASLTGFPTDTSAIVVGTSYGSAFIALGAVPFDGGASGAASVATLPKDTGTIPDASSVLAATYAANWAAAAAVGTRVIVVSDGPSSTKSVLVSAFDMGTTAAASSQYIAPASGGSVAYADVALHQDHAFFAIQVDQDIALMAFEKASTYPVFLSEVAFSSESIIPIGALRDGLVAVAASDTRVAVVWATGKTIGTDDRVGGYAVFACTP